MVASEARAVIKVYEAALAEAGLAIVPREPTRDMLRAGALHCNCAVTAKSLWDDMLAVVPAR